MAKTLFLVRHPKPMVSEGICYGQTDLAPDPLALEHLLHRVRLELPTDTHFVTSPLQRCSLTADRLPALGFAAAATDARIAEFHFGDWEGRAWTAIDKTEIESWRQDRVNFQVPGGESVLQLGQRACSALDHWVQQASDQTLGFITHAGVIQVLLAHLREGDFRRLRNERIEYGSITRIELPV